MKFNEHRMCDLRKPWLLVHIRDEMSELAEYIIEGLVENGRLRYVKQRKLAWAIY